MGLLTFLGGIHPYEGKELSMEKPVREYLPKGDCVYPLSQHIGAPATPIVKKGQSPGWSEDCGDQWLRVSKYTFIHIGKGQGNRAEICAWWIKG